MLNKIYFHFEKILPIQYHIFSLETPRIWILNRNNLISRAWCASRHAFFGQATCDAQALNQRFQNFHILNFTGVISHFEIFGVREQPNPVNDGEHDEGEWVNQHGELVDEVADQFVHSWSWCVGFLLLRNIGTLFVVDILRITAALWLQTM